MITCMVILAVDFQIFPRGFAKTETFGISLMDIGVGTFVVSSAVTSRYARNDLDDKNCKRPSHSLYFSKLQWLSPQRSIVLFLGIGRLVLLKMIDYQEHVSEYGVHWNFFVTLFFVWSITDGLHNLVRGYNHRYSLLFTIAVVWLLLYQMVLLYTPLTEFVFNGSRINLLTANKEGVVSLFGYIPLFLITEAISHYIFFSMKTDSNYHNPTSLNIINESNATTLHESTNKYNKNNNIFLSASEISSSVNTLDNNNNSNEIGKCNIQQSPQSEHSRLIRLLLISASILWLLTWITHNFVQPISRRLVNCSYVVLTLALAMSLMLTMYLADNFSSIIVSQVNSLYSNKSCGGIDGNPMMCSSILTLNYMNKHSLIVFLLANILTGVINMSMHTIYASTYVALTVMIIYTILLAFLSSLANYCLSTTTS